MTSSSISARRLRFIISLCLSAIAIAVAGYFGWRAGRLPQGSSAAASQAAWNDARHALSAGQTEVAKEIATKILATTPDFPPAHLLLGELAFARNELEVALEHFQAVPPTATAEYETALLRAGMVLLADDRLGAAEEAFASVLRRSPENLEVHRQLARLATITGRRRRSVPHLEALLRADACDIEQLLMLADPDSVIDFSVDLERALARDPTDPLPRIGLSRIAYKHRDLSRAMVLAREAVALAPHGTAAQAILGRVLLETDPAALGPWRRSLPARWADDPEIWAVFGQLAESRGEIPAAIRCYAEAVKRHPSHRHCVYRLGHLLVGQEDVESGRALLSRAVVLDELIAVVDVLLRKPDSTEHLKRAAEITMQLGRLWEAQAWHAVLQARHPGSDYARQRDELRARLSPDAPLEGSNPALALDLASYPLPDWEVSLDPPTSAPQTHDPAGESPRLRDVAQELGLEFTYFSGDDPTQPGWQIFQELGGGVGVLDYDLDAWPDLYFAQGCSWPPDGADRAHSDRLFRNLQGTAAGDVTRQARLEDADFGQGVAIGDVDNDGFPDIYVANLGVNRLYRNQGDGTFIDTTMQAGIAAPLWTSSCAIADLSGDGLPDLFDVTYLAGSEPLTRRCVSRGIARACSPDQFAGQQDRLLLNLGDGRFEDVTSGGGIQGDNGKGLGIIVADFRGQGRLDLFVANDGTPNFFYVNMGARQGIPSFIEQAVLSGLAVDGEGRSQACMGVALDDIERDGHWDLLVTNFHREGSTLYRQTSAEMFEDATRQTGLDDPSFPFTGFGAQFLDLELDGDPDLVVLNGHIEDFRYRDVPFQMRPQVFRNQGNGSFSELRSSRPGDYFEREQLGRALATIDWNRDGRLDLVATHLDEPAALLVNETAVRGSFLKLHLIAEHSSRDGFGTVVRVQTASGDRYRKQLVAGSGFQASNQRILHFGLGAESEIAELHIRWPSGREQHWPGVAAGQELWIREGRDPLPLGAD